MKLSRYLLLRLGRTLVAAWAIMSCIFLLSRLTAGDAVVRSALDETFTNPTVPLQERAQAETSLRHRYGLDVPLFYFSFSAAPPSSAPAWHWQGTANQYHRWLSSLLRGELGTSYREGTAVAELLTTALQYTLPITALAAFFAVVLTLELSIWLGHHPAWRGPVLSALHALQSLPLFVIALGLLLLLANPDALAWFPAYGLGNADGLWAGGLGQYLYHLVLPILSLVLVSIPGLIIQLDASIQQELRALYVATARAKGATSRTVIRRHVVRNALLPVLPLLTDLVPNLVAGSVVVELIYALPGMGRLLAEAAAAQDFPVLLGAVLLVALARLFSQLLADLLYQWVDPRIRLPA